MNSDNSSHTPMPPKQPKQDLPLVGSPGSSGLRSNKLPKFVIPAVVILVLVIGAIMLILTHHKNTSISKPNQSVAENPEGGKQTEPELRDFKQEVTVEITADGVSPETLNIPNNTRINWMNTDAKAHKLAITPGTIVPPQFDNPHQIDVGGGYPYVIHKSITFYYYLVDKPTQIGTVIVK